MHVKRCTIFLFDLFQSQFPAVFRRFAPPRASSETAVSAAKEQTRT
jgi:hypothetical protein